MASSIYADTKELLNETQASIRPEIDPTDAYPSQVPRKAGLLNDLCDLSDRYWIFEALCSLFAVITFIGLCILLQFLDGKPFGKHAPDGAIGHANLFAVITFLATVMKLAISVPLISGISQLKWSWYEEKRKLADLDSFDDASRGGVLAPLRLLFTVRFSHLAAIGSILVLFAIPMEAIIQSTINMPLRRFGNTEPFTIQGKGQITNETTVPRTSRFDLFRSTVSGPWPTTDMLNSIAWGNSDNTIPQPRVTVDCPTGYCQFGLYQSLGVSHICVDRSADMATNENRTAYALPAANLAVMNTVSKSNPKGLVTVRSSTSADQTSFPNIGPLLIRTSAIVNIWDDAPAALDCALFWSIHTYNGSVAPETGFSLREDRWHDFNSHSVSSNPDEDIVLIQDPSCWFSNRHVSNVDEPGLYDKVCKNTVSHNASLALQHFFLDEEEGFTGDISLYSENPRNQSRGNRFVTEMYDLGTWTNNTKLSQGEYFARFESRMASTARMMSQMIRQASTAEELNSKGTVYQMLYIYDIQWRRLAAPAVLLAASMAFAIAAALKAQRQFSFKRSNLPLVFLGLGQEERARVGEVSRVKDMRDWAGELHVQLGKGEDGMMRFVSRVVVQPEYDHHTVDDEPIECPYELEPIPRLPPLAKVV
ncbi:hypothetical protein BCR34DRAFT_587101 [Clohesyomyces aquaticus]|uniref:Uncharacterized protein n=1 Tax=Clohesyomyces aquaticus TaxID=1231657 RepID=A0A1Y1ZQX0_9PLEO|nr:hypothetical protein BCR34DRAFT_587101 [Clohesyomyces aquaticus]